MSLEQRFRATNDYAGTNGFGGGFPNFHQADYGKGVVHGTLLLKREALEWRDVKIEDLDASSTESRFRSTYDYAVKEKFVGGFPNFHQADYGNGVVFGTILLKPEFAEWRDVKMSDLADTSSNEARIRSTHDYARENGFATGLPNFHQADYGDGVVFGTILIKQEAVEWRDVYWNILNMHLTYSFDDAITPGQKTEIMHAHQRGYEQLVDTEVPDIVANRDKIIQQGYCKAIQHGINTTANVNASASIEGSDIWVNFGVLFPQGPDEIAQTLIHEVTHLAGFRHPVRQASDKPGDGGEYFSSTPLQAELVIAGMQSDVKCVGNCELTLLDA